VEFENIPTNFKGILLDEVSSCGIFHNDINKFNENLLNNNVMAMNKL
jgi:hypothetical protein